MKLIITNIGYPQRIVEFGKVLNGPQDDLLFPLIELVLQPGIQF